MTDILESFCCVRGECNESPIHQPIRAVDQFGNELKRAFGWLSSSRDPRRDGKIRFPKREEFPKRKQTDYLVPELPDLVKTGIFWRSHDFENK